LLSIQKPNRFRGRYDKILPWSSIEQTSKWEMTYWKTSLTSPKAKIEPDKQGERNGGSKRRKVSGEKPKES